MHFVDIFVLFIDEINFSCSFTSDFINDKSHHMIN